MNRRLISLLLALMTATGLMVFGAAAEEVPLDPFEEITWEFVHAQTVEPYEIEVRPTRVSGWLDLQWAPSQAAPYMASYFSYKRLTVLKETPNWLMVEDPETGDIGYIYRAWTAVPDGASVETTAELKVEENGKTNLGSININGAFSLQCVIPEGYEIESVSSTRDHMTAMMHSADPEKPLMFLSVAYDEKYADVERLNDLDDEALAVLEQTFIDVDPTVEITYGETGLGTRLLIATQSEEGSQYLNLMSIYQGYFVEFILVPSDEAKNPVLTEEQKQLCIDYLTELDFVPAAGAFSVKDLAEKKYITNLTEYDAQANTVKATVMHGVSLSADRAEALQVGDRLTAGELLDMEITSLEVTDEGDILINEECELRKFGDEYLIYFWDLEYLEPLAVLTLTIPDSLIVEDWIDKDSGEPLNEPVRYTTAEFKAMLEAETFPDFATDNTWVQFGEDGEMVLVERQYSPAQ